VVMKGNIAREVEADWDKGVDLKGNKLPPFNAAQKEKLKYLTDNISVLIEKCPNNAIDQNHIELGIVSDDDLKNDGPFNVGAVHNSRRAAIVFGMGAVDLLEKEELLAVLAHELGHIVAGDRSNDSGHSEEYTADATSVHLTRNPKAFISALNKLDGVMIPCPCCGTLYKKTVSKSSDSHPSLKDRIDNIRRVAQQLNIEVDDDD